MSRQHYEVEGGWVTQLPWKESTELTISYIVSKFESPSSYAARDIAVHTYEQNSFYFTLLTAARRFVTLIALLISNHIA